MKNYLKIGSMALAMLLVGCVSSPLGPGATVSLYTWDNRVVPFFTAETMVDEEFGGALDGAVFLTGVLQEIPKLDRREDTPYLLEVCDDEELCYYLVLFPGDFKLKRDDMLGGYAVVTEVSTAIYNEVKDLDADEVREAVDALAEELLDEDVNRDDRLDYTDIARLNHFDREKRRKQLRDEQLIDRLEEKLALGEATGVSEVTPIELDEDDPALELYDAICHEAEDDEESCEPPDREDLCELLPGERDCGRIPKVQCLLFPDQPPCDRLADSDFCAERPMHGLCRGMRLDELCMRAPMNPVCLAAKDPEYCNEYPDDPFCFGFPGEEECIDDPLNPLCGRTWFDEYCAMAPDDAICLDPPIGRVCRINPDSVFCDRRDDEDEDEHCDVDSTTAGCEDDGDMEEERCDDDPTAAACEDDDEDDEDDDDADDDPEADREQI